MADFCKQCSLEVWGEDFKDLAGLCDEDQLISVLCEGCGSTVVNSKGICISKDCLEKHGEKMKSKQPIFVLYLKDMLSILNELKQKTESEASFTGLAFGESSFEDIVEEIDILFSDNKYVPVSKIAHSLHKVRTIKIPANANIALDFIIREMNKKRKAFNYG